MYHLWYDASSVASFLVLEAGGGARPRNVPAKNICTYIARASEASERLRNIYFHDSKYIFIVIYNAVSFNYLWYGTINDTYTDKTLTLRKIYEYASELRKFSHFHILKLLFPSIFCWYFRYFVSETHSFSGLQ